MKLITNQQVTELITNADAIASMRAAFSTISHSAQQARVRTQAGSTALASMGAVLPDSGVAGCKVYTTVNGQFRFVIILFATDDGRPLAAIEADTMTGFRTAAATAVVTDALARSDARTLAVIGTGVQASAHIPALLAVRPFKEILIAGRGKENEFAAQVAAATGVPARGVSIDDAVQGGDVLVTVTRAKTPLFSGKLLRSGVFVAAVGASKKDVRELDDVAIQRANALVVEWKPQAQIEAGDLLLCAPGTFEWDAVHELGPVIEGTSGYSRAPNDIVIYKAIGVGLEDIALAGLVYRRAAQRYGW